MPAPGELHIKERRTWKSWQLVVAMVVAALAGMGLNYKTVGANAVVERSGIQPARSDSVFHHHHATTPSSASGSSGSTSTTAASGGTTTTAAGGSTTTSTAPSTAAAGPARVLMGPTQLQGNWTSPTFTTTVAGWNVGWAFTCAPVPASGPSFQVFVTPAGSSPSGTPAITGTGPSGQSVTCPVQPWSTDVGGSSWAELHVGGQGHRLVASSRVDTHLRDVIRVRLGYEQWCSGAGPPPSRIPTFRGGPTWHRVHRRSCNCDPQTRHPSGQGARPPAIRVSTLGAGVAASMS